MLEVKLDRKTRNSYVTYRWLNVVLQIIAARMFIHPQASAATWERLNTVFNDWVIGT